MKKYTRNSFLQFFCPSFYMVSELQVEDIWKNKILRSTRDEDKKNFNSRWNRLLSYQDVMEFDLRWRLLEYVSNSYLISFFVNNIL